MFRYVKKFNPKKDRGMIIAHDSENNYFIVKNEENGAGADNNSSDGLLIDGSLVPIPYYLPTNEGRSVYTIIGQSGSGKSVLAGKIAMNYQLMFPNRDIYLVTSKVDSDPAFTELANLKHLPLETFDERGDIEEYADSLMIFDDFESESDDKRKKNMLKLMAEAHNRGRYLHIQMIVILHNARGGIAFKSCLTESTHICFFPKGNCNQIYKMLQDCHGISKAQIKTIKNFAKSEYGFSRYLILHMNYPSYIMSEHAIAALEDE